MNHPLGEKFSFKRGLGYVCLPTLLALLFYWESLGAYFNPHELSDLSFTTGSSYQWYLPPTMWRPLRWGLFHLMYISFGLEPLPYRVLMLIPYICLLVLLYLLYNQLIGNKILSMIAVLLFTSFYLNAEVVISLALHQELLMALFVFASLLSFYYYRKNHYLAFYALALLFAILAGFSKETAVILPLLLLAVDYHISHGIFPPRLPLLKDLGRTLLPHLPFLPILLAIAWCASRRGIVNPFYIIPGKVITVSQFLENIYWYVIYTLSPCFITDRFTIILAFSIIAGLGWLFYCSSPQKRSLIVAIVACWSASSIPYIPQGAVTRLMFLSSAFTSFLVALLAFGIGLSLHRLLEERLKGYCFSPDLTAASFALLLLLPAVYLNYKYIRQFAQNVVYAGELTREVAESTVRMLPQGLGKSQVLYINLPASVLSRRPHCITQSHVAFYQTALDLHYRQHGIKLVPEKVENIQVVFVNLGYNHVRLSSKAWYNLIILDVKSVSAEEYNDLAKNNGNKLLFFNPVNNKLVDVSGWSYEELEGSIAPYRDKLNYDSPNFLP